MSRQNSRNVQFSDVCDIKTAIILIKFLTNQNSPIISPKSIKFSSVHTSYKLPVLQKYLYYYLTALLSNVGMFLPEDV